MQLKPLITALTCLFLLGCNVDIRDKRVDADVVKHNFDLTQRTLEGHDKALTGVASALVMLEQRIVALEQKKKK